MDFLSDLREEVHVQPCDLVIHRSINPATKSRVTPGQRRISLRLVRRPQRSTPNRDPQGPAALSNGFGSGVTSDAAAFVVRVTS